MARILGILFLLLGLAMFYRGYRAAQAGRIIPAGQRHGPMTGEHAMFAGALAFGCGAIALWVGLRRRS